MSHLDDFELAEFFGPSCTPSLRARVLEEIGRCDACRRLVVELARGNASGASADPLQRYAFEEHLGSGAWGSVHRARDQLLKRDVAIKLVHDAGPQLAREGRLLARCEHPNVVQLFDVVALGDDVALVMELMPGGTLEAWLSTDPEPRAIVDRFCAAGRGLAAAHRAGVVHGDFKARNVLLDGDRVAVADFGLGHVEQAQQTEDRLGSLLEPTWGGTPGYLAPERIGGGPATTASDQYAFGMALRLALGDPPRGVRRAIERMTQPDPRARFSSMDAVVDALAKPTPPLGVLGLLGAAIAAAGLLAATLAPPLGAEPSTTPPRTPPRSYDRDDPQRGALAVASERLAAKDFEGVLAALDGGFDLSTPESSLQWARAANFASKAHGRLGHRDEQRRLSAAAADVAVEVGHDGLAAEATITLLQSHMDEGYSPKMRSLMRRAKAYSDRALAEPGNDDADLRIDLEIELTRAAVQAGDGEYEASLETLDAAIERARELSSEASILYRTYEFRTKLRRHLGDDEGAGEDARAMIEIIENTQGPDSRDLLVPLHTLMHLASKEGDYALALAHADRAVEVVQDAPPLLLARGLVSRGGMHAIARNLEQAESDLVRAQEIFEDQGSYVDRSDVTMNLARVRAWQRRPDEALRLLERAQVIGEEAGRPDMVARANLERCRIYKGEEQPTKAARACDAAEVGFIEAFGEDYGAKAELAELRE